MSAVASPGMEDVIAGESAITWIDGRHGELRYRGYPIGELAERCTFEQVAYLLWHGELPTPEELDRLRHTMRAEREHRAPGLFALLSSVPAGAHPLDVLRYAVSRDALDNPRTWDSSADSNFRKSVELASWFPVAVAALHRQRSGEKPVLPPSDLDTAAVFLCMLYGRPGSEDQVRTLDTSLVLHADHELNASTFAARVTIATQSNLHAAVASALGTLSGPRHGGASDRVIAMLESIGSPQRAEAWVSERLDRRERVMGFGHRVYRTADPRSHHLRSMAERLLRGTEHEPWIAILDVVAGVMATRRNLYPNVDLYAAIVNHELGLAPAFYSAIFAVSRITGWTSHAIEQLDGRMIRPVSEYVGAPLRHVSQG